MAKTPIVFDGLGVRPPDEVVDFEPGSSRTKQEFAAETSLSSMMMRFSQTGIAPEMAARMGSYGDFSAAPDFMQAQEIIVRAREQFEALPAAVRDKFGNNAAMFLEWVGDEKNFDEAAKLGLLSEESVKRKVAAEKAAADEELRRAVEAKLKEVKTNAPSSG